MDPATQRRIASLGGKEAQRLGRAHRYTSDEAKAAGQKGGKAVSANRAHMAEIGRKGGFAGKRKPDSPAVGEQATQAREDDHADSREAAAE